MKESEITPDIKLTKKQEMFCRHYVSNGHNGTQAAISAGYSKKTARQIATKMLSKVYIQEFIKTLEEPVIEKLGLDENWVLTKLKNFSEADITDFFEIIRGKVTLKDFSKIPKEKIAAIESIKQTRNGIEIKLVDKKSSVIDIGRNKGMFKDVLEHSGDINIIVNGLDKV
jgi:phage terminase small subunit